MNLNERPIPEPALRDPDAIEMLRVWIAEQGLHCSIKVGMYEEIGKGPEEHAWGKILADIVRHLANGLERGYARDRDGAMRSIVDAFLEELERESGAVKGGFVSRH